MTALNTFLMTSGLAAGAAALAVPVVRRFSIGSIEHDWMAGELDLDHIHNDRSTVSLKSGDVFRVIRLEGIAYDARPSSDVNNLAQLRADALGICGNAGVKCRLFAIKRRKCIEYAAEWPTIPLTQIGVAENKRFATSFEIYWYLIVQSGNYARLTETCELLISTLGKFGPSALTQAEDDTDTCSLTSFLQYLITGDWREDLPAISSNLSVALPGSDIAFGKDGSIVVHTPTRNVSRVISIREWPDSMSGEVLAALMALPSDIEICQTALPIDKTKTTALMRRKSVELNTMAFFGKTAEKEENDLAVETLSDSKAAIFDTQFSLIITSDNTEALEKNLLKASEIMGREQISYSIDTVSAAETWFNRIPGHENLVRPLKLFNANIAGIWPFHNSPSGNPSSPYGKQPVRLFGTESGQSYSFQFHTRDEPQAPGHYLVLAPTGAGKTTLILHLLAGLTKFKGVRSYVFDSREGARFTIEGMGGVYHSFDKLTLNPLDTDDTAEARQRINLIIRSMLGEHANDDGVDDIISQLLKSAFGVEPPNRTFNALFNYSFPKDTAARSAFQKWVKDESKTPGLYEHIFNAERDGLASYLEGSHLVGINMNEALQDPVLAAPLVTHISYAISETAAKNAKGFNIFIDEAAALVENEGFEKVIAGMYREYRKLNGAVGMAFQDPAALLRSGASEAIIENTATLIIFPNALATAADFEPFNLNDEHMGFITGAHTGRKVLVIQREGATGFNESAILDIDLAWLDKNRGYYRSGVDAIKHLETVQKEHPDAWMENLI